MHHWGKRKGEDWFDSQPILEGQNISFVGERVKVAIAEFSHVFSTLGTPENEIQFNLRQVDVETLKTWYKTHRSFGHDVTDPLDFPHIKFTPPPALERMIELRRAKVKSLLHSQKMFIGEKLSS